MAQNDDSLQVNLEFTDNTAPLIQGMSAAASVAGEMRSDMEAIEQAMSGISERADAMRAAYQDNNELISNMKQLLETIASINATNQTSLSQNIQQINEMILQTRGLGGNVGHVMTMLGMASPPGVGSVNGYTYNTNQSTSSQDFSGYIGSGYVGTGDSENPVVALGDWYKGVRARKRAIKNTAVTIDDSGSARAIPPPTTGRGGGSKKPPIIPPTGGPGPITPDPMDDEPTIEDPDFATTWEGMEEPEGDYVDAEPFSSLYADQLKNRWNKLNLPLDATDPASIAYKKMNSTVKNSLGSGPLGKKLYKRWQKHLVTSGITPEALKNATSSMAPPEIVDAPSDAFGNPVTGKVRTTPVPEDVQSQTLDTANHVARIFSSGLYEALAKFTGIATAVKNAGGAIGDVYAAAQGQMGQVRNITNAIYMQSGAFGEVDTGRTINLGVQSWMKSWGGLNPFYNQAQVQAAQMGGAALGIRGAGLYGYVDTSLDIARRRWGMSQDQFNQFSAQSMGAGYMTTSYNNYMQQYNAARDYANGDNRTSLAYANNAFSQGANSAAAMGMGNGYAAARQGYLAMQFGAGNYVAQAAGMTGTEMQGSMLGNVLLAQNLGVGVMGLYGKELQLGKQGASGAQAQAMAQNASNEQILTWAGIDIKTQYKSHDEFSKKNANAIQRLNFMLQSGQLPSALSKYGASFQQTDTWAWSVVQQQKSLTHPGQSGSILGHIFGTDLGHALSNVGHFGASILDAPGALIGKGFTGVSNAVIGIGGVLAGQSLNEIKSEQNTWHQNAWQDVISKIGVGHDLINAEQAVNRDWGGDVKNWTRQAIPTIATGGANVLASYATGKDVLGVGTFAGQTSSNGGSDRPLQAIEVNIHPNAQHLITAAVKSSTQGFNNGQVPLNRQPGINGTMFN
jgi:hypothetical protein